MDQSKSAYDPPRTNKSLRIISILRLNNHKPLVKVKKKIYCLRAESHGISSSRLKRSESTSALVPVHRIQAYLLPALAYCALHRTILFASGHCYLYGQARHCKASARAQSETQSTAAKKKLLMNPRASLLLQLVSLVEEAAATSGRTSCSCSSSDAPGEAQSAKFCICSSFAERRTASRSQPRSTLLRPGPRQPPMPGSSSAFRSVSPLHFFCIFFCSSFSFGHCSPLASSSASSRHHLCVFRRCSSCCSRGHASRAIAHRSRRSARGTGSIRSPSDIRTSSSGVVITWDPQLTGRTIEEDCDECRIITWLSFVQTQKYSIRSAERSIDCFFCLEN